MSRVRRPQVERPVDSESEESDVESESESESESDEEPIKPAPRRTLYSGKKAAAKATAKPKAKATAKSTPVTQPKASASTSPPRGILRQNSPSKGTSVKFAGKTSNRLRDFFQGALKIIENDYLLEDESGIDDEINSKFKKEGLATRMIEGQFEIDPKDVPLLTETKVKNIILKLIREVHWKKPDHYLAMSKINSLARKFDINAYLVPLSEGDFWCDCS